MPLAALLLALSASAEVVHFKTSDGWTLAARYQAPPDGGPVAVLVHGVGASKEEWRPLEDELAKRGFGTLAVDLRGHGESQQGEVLWPKALEDLLAAARWLKSRGVPAQKIGFAGGSIGANLSSQAAPLVGARWTALLSPGVDYRGVACAPPGKRTLAAAAPPDEYAYKTAALLGSKGATLLTAKQGHGAQLLREPDFLKSLGDWIEKAAAQRRGAKK